MERLKAYVGVFLLAWLVADKSKIFIVLILGIILNLILWRVHGSI